MIEVGPDEPVKIEGTPLPLVEPYLAVDPNDSRHFVAGSIVVTKADLSETDCAAFTSFDGGQTWIRHDLLVKSCFDVWITFGREGVVLLSALRNTNEAVAFRSEDGGLTWPAKPLEMGGRQDHETLVTDNTQGRFAGSLYFLSTQFSEDYSHGSILLARSTDGGKSFPESVNVSPTGVLFNTMNPVVLSDGTLVTSFSDFSRKTVGGYADLEKGRSWVVTSSDGGKTFSPPSLVSEACERSFPSLAVASSSSQFRDRLFWACNSGDYKNIFAHYSPDRGESWSAPLRVNQNSGSDPYVRTPAIAVNHGGVVGIAWYDGRNDPEKMKAVFQCQNIFSSASLDGGQTFLPEVRVSSELSCPDKPENGKARYRWPAGGDYMGLVALPDGRFCLLWADSRGRTYQLRMATVKVNASKAEKLGRK